MTLYFTSSDASICRISAPITKLNQMQQRKQVFTATFFINKKTFGIAIVKSKCYN